MHWRRKWQPTPLFLPGESQGRRSLMDCRHWVTQSWTRLKRLSSSSRVSPGSLGSWSQCSHSKGSGLDLCLRRSPRCPLLPWPGLGLLQSFPAADLFSTALRLFLWDPSWAPGLTSFPGLLGFLSSITLEMLDVQLTPCFPFPDIVSGLSYF